MSKRATELTPTRTRPPARRRKTSGDSAEPEKVGTAPHGESSPRGEDGVASNATKDGRDAAGRFTSGNKIGPRWKPGQSGNPAGERSAFAELRAMVQEIGNEAITNHPQQWSQLERMLRQMFFSKNATDHQNILEFGWGKVPSEQKIEIDDSGLTDEERAVRIAAILDRARARRDRQTDGG